MASPVSSNPNAAVALGSGSGLGTFVVWLLGYLGVDMPAEVGSIVGGAVATFFLLIGRNGIRGMARILWRGNQA